MLDKAQRKVAIGMGAGFIIACLTVFVGPLFLPAIQQETAYLIVILLPITTLSISIGRLAKHRFFTLEDINGSGLTQGTAQAKLLQSLLQNTLEQTVLALPIYLTAITFYPISIGKAAILAAISFFIGRMLFFWRYRLGAGARALGFTMTFYPTLLLIGWLALILISRIF